MLNLVQTGYVISVHPFEKPSRNSSEKFNETIVVLDGYTLMCFTDFVLSQEIKDNVGYVKLGFVGFALLANVCIILRIWFVSAKRKFMRYRKKKIIKRRQEAAKIIAERDEARR